MPPQLHCFHAALGKMLLGALYVGTSTQKHNQRPKPNRAWLEHHGAGEVTVDWDTEASIAAIKQSVDSLTNGCACRTGCRTKRCKCSKAGKHCSAGCHCRTCQNSEEARTASTHRASQDDDADRHRSASDDDEESSDPSSSSDDDPEEN